MNTRRLGNLNVAWIKMNIRTLLLLCSLVTGANAQTQLWISPNLSAEGFRDLFAEDSPWPQARGAVDVFSTHENFLGGRRDSLENLIVPFIERTGIQMALEVGGLRSHNLHGAAVDQVGELTAADELLKIENIYRVGGEVSILQMDSPIGYTLATGGDTICAFDPPASARETADYMEAVLAVHPDMRFALIEPVPWYHVGDYPAYPGQDRGDLGEILQTFLDTLDARGLTLDAFHADCPYNYTNYERYNGWGKLRALETWVEERGIRFGLIYNDEQAGQGGRGSDSLYCTRTLDYFTAYADLGGSPENLLIMSWYPRPTSALPEDALYTFTNLTKDFAGLMGRLGVEPENPAAPAEFSLSLYPNPFNRSLRVSVRSATESLTHIELYSLKGERLRTNTGMSGEFILRADDLPTGLYFLKAANCKEVISQSVLLLR